MKTTFATGLVLFGAALAAPLQNALEPRGPATISIKIDNKDSGYYDRETIVVDGPAFTVGNLWRGSAIDNNIDVMGGVMSAEGTLGNVQCVLQNSDRHDIVVLSENYKIGDITGNGKSIRLTDHVIFCFTADSPYKPMPTPILDNTLAHPTNPRPQATPPPAPVPAPAPAPTKLQKIPFVLTNSVTQKSSTGVVNVDSNLSWRFIDIFDQDVNVYQDGHVWANTLTFTADPVGIECIVYDSWSRHMGAITSANWNQKVELSYAPRPDKTINVDYHTIRCNSIQA